jgi:hypothetical protein
MKITEAKAMMQRRHRLPWPQPTSCASRCAIPRTLSRSRFVT